MLHIFERSDVPHGERSRWTARYRRGAPSGPGGLSRFRLWTRMETAGVQAERLPDLMTDRDVRERRQDQGNAMSSGPSRSGRRTSPPQQLSTTASTSARRPRHGSNQRRPCNQINGVLLPQPRASSPRWRSIRTRSRVGWPIQHSTGRFARSISTGALHQRASLPLSTRSSGATGARSRKRSSSGIGEDKPYGLSDLPELMSSSKAYSPESSGMFKIVAFL